MNNSTPIRLGKPPRVSLHVITTLAEIYPNPTTALLSKPIAHLCAMTGASPATINRLRSRARAGKTLVPRIPEIDQLARKRRLQTHLKKRKHAESELPYIRAHFAKLEHERRHGRIIDRDLPYRRTNYSPKTGPFASWYVDDDRRPYSLEDREMHREAISEMKRRAPDSQSQLPDIEQLPPPISIPKFLNHIMRSQLPAPSTMPLPLCLTGSTQQLQPDISPDPIPFTAPPNANTPPTVNQPQFGVNTPILYDPNAHYIYPKRRRWTAFGKQTINDLLPGNNELYAWLVTLPFNMVQKQKLATLTAIWNHPSTVAVAVHSPDKSKSVTHLHICSLASNVALFDKYGSGSNKQIYDNSTPYNYLRYMENGANGVLNWGPAAPTQFHVLDDTSKTYMQRHFTAPFDASWKYAPYETIIDLLATHNNLRQWVFQIDKNIPYSNLHSLLNLIRSDPKIIVSALLPPAADRASYQLNILAATNLQLYIFGLPCHEIQSSCTPYSILSYWHWDELTTYPDFAIHFGPATHRTLRECNHPASFPTPVTAPQPAFNTPYTPPVPLQSNIEMIPIPTGVHQRHQLIHPQTINSNPTVVLPPHQENYQ